MTIDEFLHGAEAQLLAFKEAYNREAEKDPTFKMDRDNEDWWREVISYMMYLELEEQFKRNQA